jgi:hypothetical protein
VQDRDKDWKLGIRQRNFVLGIALTGKVPQTNPNTAWRTAQHFAGDIRDCGRRHGAKLAFGCTHQLDVGSALEAPVRPNRAAATTTI